MPSPRAARLDRLAAIYRRRPVRALAWSLRIALVALIAPRLVVTTLALTKDVPPELMARVEGAAPGDASHNVSTRFVDRDGLFMQERRADDGVRSHPVPLATFGVRLRQAIVAAEDKRFYDHSGVDWVASARALLGSVLAGRWVSGASTITQQLARNVSRAPRNASAKLDVMALAVRIEASLSKDEILEHYLNRVDFGPRIVGAEAASEHYFDKPTAALSLAEAAALAGIPRGPTLYDPRRGAERLRARRDVILDRMADAGYATPEEVTAAKADPLVLSKRLTPRPAPHLASAIEDGLFDEREARCGAAQATALPGDVVTVETTIDSDLQQRAETFARTVVRSNERQGVSAASVVVLENATGEVLAYVGSPDVTDAARLGANDGVRAARQPGSSLKPFVYELGMETRGWSPGTLFADVETSFSAPDGSLFRPRNYDERFHGPVLLRDALGNSFNVPAVRAAEELGVGEVLGRLRALGLCTLDRPPSHYGLALALGDGEVRLLDLANAYATLARGGTYLPVRAIRGAMRAGGEAVTVPEHEPIRVLDERATFLLTDVLADPSARLSSFGEGSVLELPFPVAAKTGTSKGYRDNIAVGFTSRVTVAVWVGNFDGSPMKGISGITGAGPLFQEVMRAAAERWTPGPFVEPAGIDHVEVCALSGSTPTGACPHRRKELAVAGRPSRSCEVHVRVLVDRSNGLLAGPACALEDVEERVFEALPAPFSSWRRAVGRATPPTAPSPRCPGGASPVARAELRIEFPEDGAQFHIDPAASAPSAIRIRARVANGESATLVIDGAPRDYVDGGVEWRLVPGAHVIELRRRSSGGQNETDGDSVRVTVD